MKQNKFFSISRFSRLMSADLRLNLKQYLYYFTELAIVMYLIFLYVMRNSHNVNNIGYFATLCLCLIGLAVFISSAFPDMSSRVKTSNYLLLPASIFEKALSQFLIYIVCGSILFFFLFWADANLALLSWAHNKEWLSHQTEIVPFKYSSFLQINVFTSDYIRITACLFLFSTASLLFASRLFFRKFASIKSIVVGVAVIFSVVCCLVLCSHIFYPEKTTGFDLEIPIYFVRSNLRNIELFFMVIISPAWIFFLLLAYFKLKEKQS
jgi:hypothetical protein